MDVQRPSRERVFSILNDNDCPSFVVRHNLKSSSVAAPSLTQLPPISSLGSFSPRSERPSLLRQPHFYRNSSISSAGSPPLLRYDSSSSTKSSTSMDSTPSPITPAYNYNEPTIGPYDNLLRQDPGLSFLPSPTGITPFIEQGMMMGPIPQEAYLPKTVQPLAPANYPPLPVVPDMNQMVIPALPVDVSTSSTVSNAQSAKTVGPAANDANAANAGKKNKYPCPYAASHNCTATFTTSGHAARHGKKHTGEKGVHCPICDKAFTRKDNMKQHERTHKNRGTNGEEKKSKAQTTREANKAKDQKQEIAPAQPVLANPASLRKMSSGNSEPSDTTLQSNLVDTPVDISPSFFPEVNPQIVLPDEALPIDPTGASMYPPLLDDALLTNPVMSSTEKLEVPMPQPPALIRGFSDLDTLAQAAESAFEPYFNQPQQF